MNKIIPLILFITAFTSGCSVHHQIAEDYDQYLVNTHTENNLPATPLQSDYVLNEKTINHSYQFTTMTVSYTHFWVVAFGEILDKTLKSKDVQNAFGRLSARIDEKVTSDSLISFDLENYEFKNNHAYISLNIVVTKNGYEMLNKTYHSQGKSQRGEMFWDGAFAIKNATQQSTKIALDEILKEFINDINFRFKFNNSY